MNIKKILKLAPIVGGGVVVIGGILMGVTGYWPIAQVGYVPITYGVFRDNFMMADHFYRSTVKMTGEDGAVVDAREIQLDLQRATMEGLIEQILIDGELKRKYTPDDLARLIDNKVSGVDLGTEEMQKAVELLYGLTPEQFKELVLLPKARQELLEGNLTLQNGTFNDWLLAKKKEVGVSIFVPSLYWDGTEVKLK